MSRPFNVAVFASGGGTNLQALLDHHASQGSWRVVVLVMNHEAGARNRATKAGVPVRIIPTRAREAHAIAADTVAALEEFDVDIILLAGYLRRIPAEVIERWEGRILNIHPALLPDFGGKGMYGKHVHRAVIDSLAVESGATVHFVTEEYDDGAILGQWRVVRLPADTPEDLAARVLRVEHQLYPKAVDHLCEALAKGEVPTRMADTLLQESPAGAAQLPPNQPDEEGR